jgi:hypothetical protein
MQNFIEAGLSMPENALERPEIRERMRTMATENRQRILADPEWNRTRATAEFMGTGSIAHSPRAGG